MTTLDLSLQRLAAEGFDACPEGLAILRPDGTVVHANAALVHLLRTTYDELRGRMLPLAEEAERSVMVAAFESVVTNGGARDLEDVSMRRGDGACASVSIACASVGEGAGRGGVIVAQVTDVTEQRTAERQLVHRAMHDQLTGLPTRAVFLEQLHHALARLARRSSAHVAVLFLDLDRLKEVNDTHGHAVGDELLQAVGARLLRALRPSDVLARLGGDEFTVLLEDLDHPVEAGTVADRILEELSAPFSLSVGSVSCSGSIGIAIGTDPEMRPDALIANADAAMYRAKQSGGGCYDAFDEADFHALAHRRRLESELREALRTSAFELAYQPIIDLTDGALAAAEALLRWNHPRLGQIPASQFIDVAERSGLIIPIGRWVLDEACRQLGEWDRTMGPQAPRRLFVNVGVRELVHDFAPRVAAALHRHRIEPERLCIEVTETEILADPEAARAAVQDLTELGCRIIVDDFGTGYSSLSRLTELHVDGLKVDTSFVRTMEASRQSSAIVSAILLLAHNLRLDVVAEGIESEDQLAVLREMGCQYGQGYHVSRPIDGAAFRGLSIRRLAQLEARVG